MMIRPTLCKECFKKGYDDTATDDFLLVGQEPKLCDFCKTVKPVVVKYFKWGEHTTTANSTRVVDTVAHQGINPNYSCWGSEPPYLSSVDK